MDDKINPNQPEIVKSKKEILTSLFWIVFILGFMYFSFSYFGLHDIRTKVESFGIFGPLILMLAKISTLVFAPLGGTPLYPVAGALFGPVKGFIYIFIGDAIGATLCFYISRKFGRVVAERFVTASGMQVVDRLLKYLGTTKGFIEARIFFIGFPEAVSYAAGLTKLPFKIFIVVHMLIYVIPTFILVWLGDAILNLSSGYMLLVMLGTVLLSIGGGVWFYIRTKERD